MDFKVQGLDHPWETDVYALWRCVFGAKDSGMDHPKKNDRGKMNQGRFIMASAVATLCTLWWQPPFLAYSTFHHDGKLTQAGKGGGYAHPLSLYLPSRTKLQCMIQLSRQIQSPFSSLAIYVLCD